MSSNPIEPAPKDAIIFEWGKFKAAVFGKVAIVAIAMAATASAVIWIFHVRF
jgi:hypothetical protein